MRFILKIILKWLRKFANAARGLYYAFREEDSLIVHAFVTISLLTMGIVGRDYITTTGWAVLAISCVVSIVVELLNTAIENLVDLVSFKYNVNGKKIKDISAAATLLMSLGAIVAGMLVVVPALVSLSMGK